MDYQVAIPSYKRAELLKNNTLKMCKNNGIQRDKITIFVANNDEFNDYRRVIGTGYNLEIGIKGISKQRAFYHSYYPKGTPILSFDDDISGFASLNKQGKLSDFNDINALAFLAFKESKNNGVKMWGINPVLNHFFMKNKNVYGLRYICAICFGSYAGDPVFVDPKRDLNSSGEDFESTCLSYLRYGAVMRVEWVAPKTKYFNDGGIVAELGGKDARMKDHASKLKSIIKRYPDLCSLKIKSGGVPNIRLATKTLYTTERFKSLPVV